MNPKARFSDTYRFRVTFECIAPLKDDLEWKLIFVSSPDDQSLDQELDDCMVGPVPVGINSFEFESPSPTLTTIPPQDVLGVAAIILTGSYNDQEFVRVGYYQNTEWDNKEENEQWLEMCGPNSKKIPRREEIKMERLMRELAEKPRVTRFNIKWDVDQSVEVAQSHSLVTPDASASVPIADYSVGVPAADTVMST